MNYRCWIPTKKQHAFFTNRHNEVNVGIDDDNVNYGVIIVDRTVLIHLTVL